MDSLGLLETAVTLEDEFPELSITDDEYEKLDENMTVGDIFRLLQKVHPLIEHEGVWHRLSMLIASGRGVSPESIRPETPLLHL
jgi:hypothetical protein